MLETEPGCVRAASALNHGVVSPSFCVITFSLSDTEKAQGSLRWSYVIGRLYQNPHVLLMLFKHAFVTCTIAETNDC